MLIKDLQNVYEKHIVKNPFKDFKTLLYNNYLSFNENFHEPSKVIIYIKNYIKLHYIEAVVFPFGATWGVN